MKLYELPASFAQLEALAVDGELTDEHLAKLADLEASLKDRVQAVLCVARNFAARAAARKAEADRLYGLAQTDANNEKRLLRYVEDTLLKLGMDRIETDLFRCWMQTTPPKVSISPQLSATDLPLKFRKVNVEADKSAILAAHKNGELLPEGVGVTQTKTLRVK